MAAEVRSSIAWAPVLQAAQHLRVGRVWTQQLADALEQQVRPDAAAVYLCPLGNVIEASFAVSPRAETGVAERLVNEILPRLRSSGTETPCEVFANLFGEMETPLRQAIRREALEPAGFQGLLGGMLRSRDGMLAGMIAVFCRAPELERLAALHVPLGEVCRSAEETLRSAISVAEMMGARLPKISPDPLSAREREIAQLAAKGFSDLNIAGQLSISEGTVGRHLHHIYRKLGVNSRLELSDVLCVGS